jgi:hypothetical protein
MMLYERCSDTAVLRRHSCFLLHGALERGRTVASAEGQCEPPVSGGFERPTFLAMARGLRQGDGGAHLQTFHPPGGAGSSQWFQADDWLDFNLRQNGHQAEFTGRYDQTKADYDKAPVKPVLDGEPIYEDHPVFFEAKKFGHSTASDVRRPLYWDLFARRREPGVSAAGKSAMTQSA